jgi:hypothetical protein
MPDLPIAEGEGMDAVGRGGPLVVIPTNLTSGDERSTSKARAKHVPMVGGELVGAAKVEHF